MHLRALAISAISLLLLNNGAVTAQQNLPEDYLTKEFHKGRREAARAMMPDSSVLIVFAAPTRVYSNDVEYNYHQNPDLYYFTGYKEPQAVLFLFKEVQKNSEGVSFNELFFVQPKNEREELWHGRRLGETGVKEKLGISNVESVTKLGQYQLDLSSISKVLVYKEEELLNKVAKAKDSIGKGLLSQLNLLTITKTPDTKTYTKITTQLRDIKTPEELALIRKAVEISCMGQNEVMKTLRPDMSELEIQGLHEYVHKRYGAEHVGYGSIIGSGENGCILHYVENAKKTIGNEMLLMDVGAEYHGYTADVTRTIPADGKFSKEEKAIYKIVYDAQEAAFAILKDGASWQAASSAARKTVADGLLQLGIINEAKEANQYFPHGLGHHIGMDVHDRGRYDTLRKNMVLTIEPGIYIKPNSKCDKKWWGIAVRIEDDVLIREKDFELLSRFSPRSIEDIERMMEEKSVLDNYKLPALPSAAKKAF